MTDRVDAPLASELKLVRPTVADVLAFLRKQRLDAPFRIEDADTSWTVSVIPVRVYPDGSVWFGPADYNEMETGE